MSDRASQSRVPETDAFAGQVLRFVAVLRRLGLSVGTGQALDAIRALSAIDLAWRDDAYAALRAVLLDAHAHESVFATAFERFWQDLQPAIQNVVAAPAGYAPAPRRPGEQGANGAGRAAETVLLTSDGGAAEAAGADGGLFAGSQAVAYSAAEALRQRDFAHLSPQEMQQVRRLLPDLAITVPLRRLRRTETARGGALLDLRRAVRRNLRYGGEVLVLPRRRRKRQPRPLVLLCDISGSMERYTRLLLLFLHATTQGLQGVETFVFGTRLTRITHQLRLRDPDRALDEVAHEVHDFAGGTRIGAAISTFNRRWARRVLGRGAIVVVISDGWDRGDPALLGAEMAHLRRSCYVLAWLNPLLGIAGYQPLTRGMSAALPHVDLFLPAHNLASLEALAAMLGTLGSASGYRAR